MTVAIGTEPAAGGAPAEVAVAPELTTAAAAEAGIDEVTAIGPDDAEVQAVASTNMVRPTTESNWARARRPR